MGFGMELVISFCIPSRLYLDFVRLLPDTMHMKAKRNVKLDMKLNKHLNIYA